MPCGSRFAPPDYWLHLAPLARLLGSNCLSDDGSYQAIDTQALVFGVSGEF